jgi:hypothetical protein
MLRKGHCRPQLEDYCRQHDEQDGYAQYRAKMPHDVLGLHGSNHQEKSENSNRDDGG